MTSSARSGRSRAFTDAQVEAGFWLVLAHALRVGGPSALVTGGDVDEGGGATPSVALPDLPFPGDSPHAGRIRSAILSARARVAADPSLTLSVVDHDRARLEVLEGLGQVSHRGAALWPVGSRTVSVRLGGGSWSGALTRFGLALPAPSRPRGNRRFAEGDYRDAVRDFLVHCSEAGIPATFSAYGSWSAARREAGIAVPTGATLRQRFGTWSGALAAPRED